ncbi:MAG: class I SAM-dependent methyltransferase [Gemmatimonadetes bacterium]|jgi:hypothetical protein|nr:class I SAM-dependent methyltransferase [Gemmatimonadota bacterium]
MYLMIFMRDQLLSYLPKGGVVAEIGVAEGYFSKTILETTLPSKLHLIDPWEHQERTDYANDPNNVPDQENEMRYRGVVDKFSREIAAGKMEVHRNYSSQVIDRFPDGYFDWIYVDALHTYEGVSADLNQFAPKVKADGFILGHDYTNCLAAQEMSFGVVEAVDDFVRQSTHQFAALTHEAFPTYVLSRSDQAIQSLLSAVLLDEKSVVEIKDYPGRKFVHHLVLGNGVALRYKDGTFMHVPSF